MVVPRRVHLPSAIQSPLSILSLLIASLLECMPERFTQDQTTDCLTLAFDALLPQVSILVHEVVLVKFDDLLLDEGTDVCQVFGLLEMLELAHTTRSLGHRHWVLSVGCRVGLFKSVFTATIRSASVCMALVS